MYFRVKVKLRKKLFGHLFDQLKEKYKNLQTFLIGVPLLVKKKKCHYLYNNRDNLLLSIFVLTQSRLKPQISTALFYSDTQ